MKKRTTRPIPFLFIALTFCAKILFASDGQGPHDEVSSGWKVIAGRTISVSILQRERSSDLRVTVLKKRGDPLIRYDDIAVRVLDQAGGALQIKKLNSDAPVYIEGTTGSTTATGFYLVTNAEHKQPNRIQLLWNGEKLEFSLVKPSFTRAK